MLESFYRPIGAHVLARSRGAIVYTQCLKSFLLMAIWVAILAIALEALLDIAPLVVKISGMNEEFSTFYNLSL